MAAYGLWRVELDSSVHRRKRADSESQLAIILLGVRAGETFAGRKIVPERIRETRGPYVAALRAADTAWDNGNLDVSVMEAYLAGLLGAQLTEGWLGRSPVEQRSR